MMLSLTMQFLIALVFTMMEVDAFTLVPRPMQAITSLAVPKHTSFPKHTHNNKNSLKVLPHDLVDTSSSSSILLAEESWRQYVPLVVSCLVIVDILLGSPAANLVLKPLREQRDALEGEEEQEGETTDVPAQQQQQDAKGFPVSFLPNLFGKDDSTSVSETNIPEQQQDATGSPVSFLPNLFGKDASTNVSKTNIPEQQQDAKGSPVSFLPNLFGKDDDNESFAKAEPRRERIDTESLAEEALEQARNTMELRDYLDRNKSDWDRMEDMKRKLEDQTQELDDNLNKVLGKEEEDKDE